jgi:hypothetical protein
MSSPETDAKTDQISSSGLAEDCIIDAVAARGPQDWGGVRGVYTNFLER